MLVNITGLKVNKKVCIKPTTYQGSALIYVVTFFPVNFMFQDSSINDVKNYQQMYLGDDMAVIVFFQD